MDALAAAQLRTDTFPRMPSNTMRIFKLTHRTLAEALKRIGAPLDRAALLARRHKLIEGTASEVTHPQM